jgi:outer membrane autotransporter protein
MPPDQGWTAWAQGLGRWSQTGADAGIAGAQDASSGAVLGLDRVVSDGLAVGGAFSFGHTDMKSAGTVARTNIYAGAAYVTWLSHDWVVDGRLAGGSVSGRTNRSVDISGVAENLTGTPGGWGLLADGSAGRRFTLSGIDVEPYGGLLLQIYRQNAYAETGDAGLAFVGQDFSRAQTALGARMAAAVDILGLEICPRADIAWTHDLGNAGLTTHAALFDAPFVIDAAQPGRDAARVSAGLSTALAEGFSLMVGYDGEFRGNATSHQVSGGIRVTF